MHGGQKSYTSNIIVKSYLMNGTISNAWRAFKLTDSFEIVLLLFANYLSSKWL